MGFITSKIMADPTQVLLCFLSLIQLNTVVSVNKYSEERNDPNNIKYQKPFRMNKINLIWEKAHTRLPTEQLSLLHSELHAQDKLEIELKHRRANDMDSFGDFEAQVQKSMLEILIRFDLEEHREFVGVENDVHYDPKWKLRDINKMDKKMAKLWHQAELSGFSKDEMEILQDEFIHHQSKVDEYHRLKKMVEQIDDYEENSLEILKELNIDWTEARQLQQDFKDAHGKMNDGYKYLEQRSQRYPPAEFEDEKVLQLWLLAKKANFTEVELASLKNELVHFQQKILKHSHYVKEKSDLEEVMKSPEKRDNQIHLSNLETVQQKEKDYAFKVKKVHHDLKVRIEKAMGLHTEL